MSAPGVTFLGASSFTDAVANETVAATWAAGDRIVILGMTEDQNRIINTPTVTGLTFTPLAGTPTTVTSSCKGYGWSATAAASGSGTITATGTAATKGLLAWKIAAGTSAGIGTPVIVTSTAKTASLTRAGVNSAILGITGDWSADADVTVTSSPAGGTQRVAATVSNKATYFGFDWPDQGAVGTTSYGVAGATGTGMYTKILVEVQGLAGDTTPPVVSVTSGASQKLSGVTGKDTYSYSFQVNEAAQAYEVRVVPATNSLHTVGTLVESGGAVTANTTVSGTITEAELVAASPGDGSKIIKFFAQDSAGNWSV